MSESLEAVLSVKAKEDLASAMVHVLHHEGLAKEFIAELALQEILKSGESRLSLSLLVLYGMGMNTRNGSCSTATCFNF